MANLENIDTTAPADSLYEGSVKINLIRVRVDGLYTVLSDITTAEANQIENLGTTAIAAAQWVYVSELNQSLTTTSTVTFGTINAFTLGGKLTAGAVEIEGSAFDINGGTIDGVSLTDITMSLGSDADGDIYYRSSNKLTRLAKGTEDYVLTMGAAVPEWAAAGAGAGDITGPDTSTDHAIARWHETGGDELLDSGITIDDSNVLTIGSGHTLDVSSGTLTLAADQISGDKVEGGTIAAITIAALTINTSIKLEGGTYDTTIVPGTPTESVSYTWPAADGTSGQVLQTNASGVLSWTTAAGAGDVTAAANMTDHAIVRGDGGTKGVQDSGITITDADVLTLAGDIDATAGTYKILVPDNEASAFRIEEGGNGYITIVSTDGSETVKIENGLELWCSIDLKIAGNLLLKDAQSAALTIAEAGNAYLTFVTTNAAEKITLGKKLEAGSVEIEGTNFDINGGAIDNTPIGATTPSTGVFTQLSLDAVGELRFYDDGNYVGFEAPALDADQIWVLPTADGAANEVLKTDGSGTLGWVSAPGADQALSNLASVAINESLISDTDDTDDLGSAAKEWKDLFIDGTATIDSLVADTADINAGTIDGVTIGGAAAVTMGATEVSAAQWALVGALTTDPVGGDGTAGRILRRILLKIDNGSVGPTLKCTVTSAWNGNVIAEQDNIAKGATTGQFTLDANGETLAIEAAGLAGNCVCAWGNCRYNASGQDLIWYIGAISDDITLVPRHPTDASLFDLTTLVDTGYFYVNICYITDA